MASQVVRQSSGAEPGFFYGYIVVMAAFFIMVAMVGSRYAFGVFFNPILAEFGWTRTMTSGAFSLSIVMEGLIAIAMGGLTDRLGPRAVLTLCGFLLGLGYLLMSQIGALWQLYLFYGVIIGIGMSGAVIPLVSIVARWFVARRTLMTGIVLTGSAVGSLIAPPVAERLISAYDWRLSSIILGSIVFIVVVLAAQLLKRDPTKMMQVPYGENKEGEQGFKSVADGFSLREAAHTKQFWVIFAMLLCFGFSFFTIMVHIVPHAIELGISAASSANILAAIGGLAIVGRVLLGSTADRIGNKQATIIAFILMSAALFWLLPATEVWMLYLFAVVFGFAHGGHAPSQSPLVAGFFGLRSHGLIFGIMGFAFTIGSAIGPLLAGYIFDVTGSYHIAFLLCAVLGIAGLVLTVLLKPIRGEHCQNEVPPTV